MVGAFVGIVCRNDRDLLISRESLVVHLYDLAAARVLLIKILELGKGYGCHYGVSVVLVSDVVHIVFPCVCPLVGTGICILVDSAPRKLAGKGRGLFVCPADTSAVAGGKVLYCLLVSIVKAIQDMIGQGYGVLNREDGVEFWFEMEAAGIKND